jgi:hypothetical protein
LFKEPYRLCKNDYETEGGATAQQRAVEPFMNEMNESSVIDDIYSPAEEMNCFHENRSYTSIYEYMFLLTAREQFQIK